MKGMANNRRRPLPFWPLLFVWVMIIFRRNTRYRNASNPSSTDMKLKRNFFKQPARGFDADKQGRTNAQIEAFEAKAGFKLPAAYCELMRLQNGGSVRHQKIAGADGFCFDGPFSRMRPEPMNFKDYILCTCDEEELAAARKELSPFQPERLVLFFGLDGHSAAFFDYGYRQTEAVANPSIVFISDDGGDFLHFSEMGPRFASFEDFLDSLYLDTSTEDSRYIGIVSRDDYDVTMQQIAAYLGLDLETHTEDSRNANFNFARWHSAFVPLDLDHETMLLCAEQIRGTPTAVMQWSAEAGRTIKAYGTFSPNLHRAGTYLYQDNPELTVVLQVITNGFPLQKAVDGLIAKLRQMPRITDVVTLPE
jgi:hypothetical protein